MSNSDIYNDFEGNNSNTAPVSRTSSNTNTAIGVNNSIDNHSEEYLWSNHPLPQLQDSLRQRGQPTVGNRNTLKKRQGGVIVPSLITTIQDNSSSYNNSNNNSRSQTTANHLLKKENISPMTNNTMALSNGNEDMEDSGSNGSFVRSMFDEGIIQSSLGTIEKKRIHRTSSIQSIRSKFPKRTNSFSAHFTEFINRRKEALETQRQEISVYTSPMTVLSYFVLYILHEFRVALLWIFSQQYLLVAMPIIAMTVYFIYQTDGAHQPLLKHAELGLIWYGYWTLLGIASSVGLGTGLHTFVLFLGPHIADVTLTAYKCGNTNFDVRGDHRYICKPLELMREPLTIYTIFQAVQWESFFWGFGTAIGELPPYFVARAAALSGNRNEELAAIEDLLKKKPDSVSYKERILLMVHEGMKRLGFFGIFLCASIPNPLFDLAGITCGHFLIPFSTFFGATFLGKAVVKSSIQTLFVILMFSADTLAAFMGWLETSVPLIHGYLADGINSQKGALHGKDRVSEDELENSTSLVGLIWNTIIFIMISYFLLSIVETMALAQIKRRHDQEIVELEGKIRSGDTKEFFVESPKEFIEPSKQ